MVVLVDTDAGITGIGQGGSPDTVRNVARSVIGRNPFDTEMIWQAAYMDGFYSPGKERLHALGAIDLALWDIQGKALNVPLHPADGALPPVLRRGSGAAPGMACQDMSGSGCPADFRLGRVRRAAVPRQSVRDGHCMNRPCSNSSGFEVCGATQDSCRSADARVDGSSVVLTSVHGRTRVRYAWGGSPACPLSDGSGLPARPFEMPIR